jgi:hypothetical protein
VWGNKLKIFFKGRWCSGAGDAVVQWCSGAGDAGDAVASVQ